MRRVVRHIDPGFFVVLAICIVALWPFISNASLPQETDAELHIFRLYELGYLVRGGEFYPRWAPNFYHGYGYPIFNYYAPLTYYVGLLFELLPPFDAVAGVKAVFMLGLVLAGWGMYGFVRDNWGRSAGYVATAVYVYAPYIQYIDPHARGVLAESFSFGLFPLALWALDRWRRQPTPVRWLTAVLLVAAVVVSHNLMGLLFFGLLLAWVVWMIGGAWYVGEGIRRPLMLLVVMGLGLGVAAFFWVPVVLEQQAVNLNTLIGEGDNYDFRTHFLSLSEMFSFSRRLDWGATEPLFRFNLGVAQWVLGGWGVLTLMRRQVRQVYHLWFFLLTLLVLLFLMLPVSTMVWDAVPFLPFFQFPWRLLGAAAAMLSILAGAGVAAAMSSQRKRGLTAVFVVLPILFGLPLSEPAPWPDFEEVNLLRMSLIEHSGRWLGTTSTADFVPVTVDIIPERNGKVVKGFTEGTPLDRINWAVVPAEATIETEYVTPLFIRYTISSPKKFFLRLFLFDFPGWMVRLNDQLIETELGRPEGFLVVPVPAGDHVVEVEFGSTPARSLAGTIVAIALLLTAVTMWFKPGPISDISMTHEIAPPEWWIVGLAVMGVTAVYLLILQPLGWLHYESTGLVAEPAQKQVQADFGEQIALIGYDTTSFVVGSITIYLV